MTMRILMLFVIFICSILNCRAQDKLLNKYVNDVVDGENIYISGEIYKYQKTAKSYVYYMRNQSDFSVIIYSDHQILSVGDSPTIYGKVNKFKKATNDGEFDLQSFYYSQKILFSVELERVCKRDDNPKGKGYLYKNVYAFRDTVTDKLLEISDNNNMGTFISIALGDKSMLSSEIKDVYKAVGFSHILAISGMHISIIGMGLYRALRGARMPLWLSVIFAGFVTYLYYFMTGCGVSTLRAFGMFFLVILSNYLGRSTDMLNSLGLMISIIVFRNPFIVGYSGFIFSVFAIIAASFVDINKVKSLKNVIISNIIMQLATLPLIAYYYYEIPVFSMCVNIILLPFLSIVLLVGIIGTGAGFLSIAIGRFIMFLPLTILKVYDVVCKFFSDIPGNSFIVGQPAMWKIVVYYVLIFGGLTVIKYHKDIKNFWKTKIFILSGMTILLFLVLYRSGEKELVVLDVGQGACSYMQTENGTTLMFDGGSSSRKNIAENVILPFLKYRGIKTVDYWFVSHADEDHMNGVVEAINKEYKIRYIVIGKTKEVDEKMKDLIGLCNVHGINVIEMSAGDKFSFEKTEVECLWPNIDELTNEGLDTNSQSLVLLFKDDISSGTSFSGIFAGDIPSEIEKKLVAKYQDKLDVDFYMVTHHGSKFSSCEEWVKLVSPEFAVISCGKNNRYGHPHEETIERLEKYMDKKKIIRTDEFGQIIMRKQQNMLSLKYENNR